MWRRAKRTPPWLLPPPAHRPLLLAFLGALVLVVPVGRVIQASEPATFTWVVDTVAPFPTIGQYRDAAGRLVNAAPAPCNNPGDGVARFEIKANEPDCEFQCRLSHWNAGYGDFDNAMERWSAATVQTWLADGKHLTNQQVQLNLTKFAAQFKGMAGEALARLDDGVLRKKPFAIDAGAARSNTRTAILNAVDAQKQPFTTCRTDRAVPAVAKEYTSVELGHGKKLFQLRAIDAAGNVAEPAEYIWFVDLAMPTISLTKKPARYTQRGKVDMEWKGAEASARTHRHVPCILRRVGARGHGPARCLRAWSEPTEGPRAVWV